jgi:hypothetical protein
MKPFISTIAALALAGCVSTAGPAPAPISALPDQLQSAITRACGVVLTAQSLSTVLSLLGGGGLADLTGAAAQVCASLTGPAARARAAGSGVLTGSFHGHPIVGKRVR